MRGPLAAFPSPPATGGFGVEIGRAVGDPCEKGRKPGMGAQGIDGVITAHQFCLGQGSVDLVMADLVQKHDRPALAAAQFRRQVMQALFRILRDRAVAKRADGRFGHRLQEWRGCAFGQGAGRHG